MKISILLIGALLITASCFPLTDIDGNRVDLVRRENGLAALSTKEVVVQQSESLKAMVKGSIYETGESVSVFGTCMNSTDESFIGSYATMNSWYPNGTMFQNNVSMLEMQTGYFVYTGLMSAVQGTYLTEMTCHVNGSLEVAKAWGEWQNPMWVKRISDLNDSLSNLSVSVNISNLSINVTADLTNVTNAITNLSVQIGNMSVNMSNSFAITWVNQNYTNTLINNSYINLTQQLIYVANVANSSVDRNDSYLAQLMEIMIAAEGVPLNRTLTIIEYPDDDVRYAKDWNIYIQAKNEYNATIGYPLISCFINTTDQTNQQMTSVNDLTKIHDFGGLVGEVPGFYFTERIVVHGNWNWSTWCVYN